MHRMMRYVVVGVLLAAAPAAAWAQASDAVEARANVLAQLNVAGQEDLDFGDVIPGFPRTVAPADADAGRFLVTGAGTLEITLSFTALPTALLHTDGVTPLSIAFGGGSAGYGGTSVAVDATFDPAAGETTNLQSGDLYVFIGGTVTPTADQLAGEYTGTITLDVAYTGN